MNDWDLGSLYTRTSPFKTPRYHWDIMQESRNALKDHPVNPGPQPWQSSPYSR